MLLNGAVDEDAVSLFDQRFNRRCYELCTGVRARFPVIASRLLLSNEGRHERALLIHLEIEPSAIAKPPEHAEALAGRAPVRRYRRAGFVRPQPCGEVVEALSFGEDGRKADNPAPVGILATKQPLDQHLVPNLPRPEADHMALVQDDEADIVDHGWVLAGGKV